MDAWQLVLELIGIAVCGKAPSGTLKEACTPEALGEAYALTARHDLAHLVGQGAAKLQLPDSEPLQKCRQAAMQAFLRYTRQAVALQNACSLLEVGQIPFIPLKGSVLRQWYPEPWLRTSCDIDILVREQQLSQARGLLEAAGWKFAYTSPHDISLYSPEGVHLELHHTVMEDCNSEIAAVIMAGVWEDARVLPGWQYRMGLSDGLFYYYHMAHMAKHFLAGGCGIRPFLDIWILNHVAQPDVPSRQGLLEKGGMAGFARAAEKLSEIWFSGQPMDERSKAFEAFVLSGGTYGNLGNWVSVQQARKGSKLRYLLDRIFLPHIFLKYAYPVLQKHKWLTPVFWVVRWFRLLFGGKLTHSVQELKKSTEVTGDTRKEVKALLDYLKL